MAKIERETPADLSKMTGCQKFVNWILCCRDDEEEINASIGSISWECATFVAQSINSGISPLAMKTGWVCVG